MENGKSRQMSLIAQSVMHLAAKVPYVFTFSSIVVLVPPSAQMVIDIFCVDLNMRRRNAPFKLVKLMSPMIHMPSTLLTGNKAVLMKFGREFDVTWNTEFDVPAIFATHKPIDINCDLTFQLLIVNSTCEWNGGAKHEGFAIQILVPLELD